MINLNSLFKDSTAEGVNLFFGQPKSRKKLRDDEIVSSIFACRAVNNQAGFEQICRWTRINRPKLINKISRAVVIADSSLKGCGIDLSFKFHDMNNAEHAFTLMSALDGQNTKVFNAIIDVLDCEAQIKIFDFLTRMLYFKFKSYNLLKINDSALRDFIRNIQVVQEEMSKRKLQSTLLRKTMSAALTIKQDFQAAREELEGIQDREVPYARLQINFREACATGNFKAAHDFGISMVKTALVSPWLYSGFGTVGRFDSNACLIALRRTYELLDVNDLDPFLISGTLLGMVRDGKVFDHDKDFDIALIGWEKQFDVFERLYRSGEYDLDIRALRGEKSSLLSIRHKSTGIVGDIFFMRPQGDMYLHNVDFELGFVIPFLFSKFSFEKKEFGADVFRIPAQWEKNLSENYGAGWSVPDSGYDVLIESPAVCNKASDAYKALALDRLLGSIMNSDTKAYKRKIKYLRGLKNTKEDYFFEFLNEYSGDDISL